MVYLITYEFPDREKLPDAEFFELLESLGQLDYCLENSVFVNAAYLSKGIMDELDEYILRSNAKVIISRVTKDFSAKLREHSRRFLMKYWSRIPEIEDLGRLPAERAEPHRRAGASQ
ncbi:MAG: hypothetical protein FWE66_01915 [Oscillospiraceae bacterium]|nr:hypothetical protein [Oscillospiraceae bacterium]